VVSGNSSALAKWDAKLGVHRLPYVAGLSSLSPDGGPVVLVDIMVDRVFNLAYVHGDKSNREPPWDEGEEQTREDRWREKYAAERTRLQEALRKSLEPIEDLFERLASQAEDSTAGCDLDSMAVDRTEADFDELLAAKGGSHRLRSMSASQIGHIARYARERLETEVQSGQAQLEADLNVSVDSRIAAYSRPSVLSEMSDLSEWSELRMLRLVTKKWRV
jgi:breast cancer 2 susceptibility protein